MRLSFEHNGKIWSADTINGIDLSNPVSRDGQGVEAYYIPPASFTPFKAGDFVGSIELGGSCNCESIAFCAHGNGTHTENASHVMINVDPISQMPWTGLMMARLISIEPVAMPSGDLCIQYSQLVDRLNELSETALIVRTLPNNSSKKERHFSGSNPPYFEAEALQYVKEKGVLHLLFDMPSVDREEDGGIMAAHKHFFTDQSGARLGATITELIFVPEQAEDGIYLLNLQIPSMQTDAVPSRPIIYPIQ